MWNPLRFGVFAAGLSAVGISAYVIAAQPLIVGQPPTIPGIPVEKVLDGDTVVKNGEALHIRGIDAPELAPWAKCWAEAALAGHSKDALESELLEKHWKLIDRQVDAKGHASVRIVDQDGYDISDSLSVSGYVAVTNERWDWCNPKEPLHQVEQDTPAPYGPNLWWPSGNVYDPRAAD